MDQVGARDNTRPAAARERFALHGDVDHAGFPDWIRRYGAKLAIRCEDIRAEDGRLLFEAAGAADLLDALELGCSLGPIEVGVTRIERTTLA